LTNAYDAKRAWLEAALYDGVEISEPLIYIHEMKGDIKK